MLALLDSDDVYQMTRVVDRAKELSERAAENGVGLMVDAEQTYFQPAIRHIVVNILMPSYNTGSEPVVYNTQQCYLQVRVSVCVCVSRPHRSVCVCDPRPHRRQRGVCVCVCVCVPPTQEAERSVLCDLALSDKAGFSYGVKLVRGAYMKHERSKASKDGYPDPLWPNQAATDACYNSLLQQLISRSASGTCHVMIASHNQDSIEHALAW